MGGPQCINNHASTCSEWKLRHFHVCTNTDGLQFEGVLGLLKASSGRALLDIPIQSLAVQHLCVLLYIRSSFTHSF